MLNDSRQLPRQARYSYLRNKKQNEKAKAAVTVIRSTTLIVQCFDGMTYQTAECMKRGAAVTRRQAF